VNDEEQLRDFIAAPRHPFFLKKKMSSCAISSQKKVNDEEQLCDSPLFF